MAFVLLLSVPWRTQDYQPSEKTSQQVKPGTPKQESQRLREKGGGKRGSGKKGEGRKGGRRAIGLLDDFGE